jgi:hypothetical protein
MADEAPESEEDDDPATNEHKQYLKERDALIDAARESARTFDKAVLTFGSAVFGFSIAFLKDVAPHPALDTLPWLGGAWFSFACGLLLILLSFLFSHRACMFEVECATNKVRDPNCPAQRNIWSVLTDWCNFLCIGCLFFGLLTWSVFAFKNLGKEGNQPMNRVDKPSVEKGYVPPPPAKQPAIQPPSVTIPAPAEKN